MKLIFVIPVYNELSNIPHLIKELKQSFPAAQLIFSDDGSTDGTETYFKTSISNCVYLRNPSNEGPGSAFNTAMTFLFQKQMLEENLIITIEGDQTSNLNDLQNMVEKAGTENTVLASVYLKKKSIEEISYIKQISSRVVQWIIIQKYGLNFQTYSSFYRVYQGRHISQLIEKYGQFCNEKGFVSQLEVLLKLHHLKCNLIEMPTEVLSTKRKGESKMKILNTTLAYLRFFLRFRYSN